MRKTVSTAGTFIATFALAGLLLLVLAPSAHAALANAALGGGNALARAMAGQSQGLEHASSTSGLLDRLTFASTRGGRPDEVPPPQSNAGGNNATTTPQGSGGGEEESSDAQDVGSGNNNGGATSGNGGNGGNAALGGLVRAGSVVSNATALNVLNTNIVRISNR